MFDTLRDNSRIIVYIVVVAFVISGAFMGYGAYLNQQGGNASQQRTSVIAEVNGKEISQQEYLSSLQQQAPQSNLGSSRIVPFRYNVLNLLIERKLLMSEANERQIKVEVSEEEISDNYNNILEQNEMTDQELSDNLAEQGYTIGQFRDDIKANLKNNKLINKTIDQGIGELKVSEEEIKNLYDSRYPAENDIDPESEDNSESKPKLAEVKADLKTELRNQKRNKALNSWLKELKTSADIIINDPVLSAYHALENENYAEAVEGFNQLVEQEQTDAIFYNYLAQAYKGQDNLDKAQEVYKNAVTEFPENDDLSFNYAQFLVEQNENEKAIEQLDQVAENADGDFMTHYQLYMLYSQLEAEEKAETQMKAIQNLSKEMENQAVPEKAEQNSEELEVEEPLPKDSPEIEDSPDTEENSN